MARENIRSLFRRKLSELQEVREGTWFTRVLQRVLTAHRENVSAEFFKKKYPGLDNERVAHRLISAAAHHAGIAGGSAAAAISAAELGAVETAGASLAVAVSSFAAELTSTTYIQLKMVYDIALVLEVPFDLNDPEDLMTIFWYALGVQKWEEVVSLVRQGGPRSAEYLGRKALRHGVRKGMQKVAQNFGGQKLARKITEKALLRLFVPGVNIPIAYFFDRRFTKKLGKTAIGRLMHRAAVVGPTSRLLKLPRDLRLLAVALIYQIGIQDEAPDIASRVIEMQDTATRRFAITSIEEQRLDDLIEQSFGEFVTTIASDCPEEAKPDIIELAMIAATLSNAAETAGDKLERVAGALGRSVDSARLAELRRALR